MLERLLEQRDAVTLVLTGVPNIKNLSAQQWTTAQDITAALRPFMLVTHVRRDVSDGIDDHTGPGRPEGSPTLGNGRFGRAARHSGASRRREVWGRI